MRGKGGSIIINLSSMSERSAIRADQLQRGQSRDRGSDQGGCQGTSPRRG